MSTTELLAFLRAWAGSLAARARRDERGEITEKVILVAAFAALALGVAGIIVYKVTEKAKTIPTS